jgi:hypothetical protein
MLRCLPAVLETKHGFVLRPDYNDSHKDDEEPTSDKDVVFRIPSLAQLALARLAVTWCAATSTAQASRRKSRATFF